jgi:hypothetical protein
MGGALIQVGVVRRILLSSYRAYDEGALMAQQV